MTYRFGEETPKGMRAVYCCCNCELLGYLPEKGKKNDVIRFAVGDEKPCFFFDFEVEMLALSVDGQIDSIDAYKSRDYPIEKLRKISGWVDA